jgi:hypothetical protein
VHSGLIKYDIAPYLACIHGVCVEIRKRQQHRPKNTMDNMDEEEESGTEEK